MKTKRTSRTTTALAATLALGALSQAHPALAQNAPAPATPVLAPEDGGTLTDIVVTANRREQSLQKVGISVTAFGGEQLQQLGFNNATDIVKLTPGLNILSSSASNTNVNIRGVSQNDFADHLEGPIAVYADDGYLGNAGALNGQTYDLERIEVERGPQGTLFGRNATGGLIQYISRAPTKNFEGYFQADIGERNLAQFEGAVSGPLSDTVRARLSLAGIRSDGYVKNTIGPDPANRNNISGRLQIVADLSPTMQIRLMVNGNTNGNERGNASQSVPLVADANGQGRVLGRNEIGVFPNIILGGTITGACPGCDVTGYRPPADPFVRALSSAGTFSKDIFHAQGKLTSELGSGINLTTVSDYLYVKKALLGTDTDGGPAQSFNFDARETYHQFSQEVRLDGEIGDVKWLAGGFYLNIKGNYGSSVVFDASPYVGAPVCNIAPNFPCPTPVAGVVGTSYDQYQLNVESWSGFAQLEYAIAPRVSVIGGLRYTHDTKSVNYLWTTNAIPFPSPTLYNPSTDPTARRTFPMVSAKAEIDWRPGDDTLLYASYSRGTKGGNWALPAFPPPITAANFPVFPHKSEVLTDYEIGMKTEFLDRKARLNIGAFYYIYDNYQAFSLAGAAQSILNKDAKAWGGEAELLFMPMRGLTLSAGVSTMWSRVYDMQYPTGGRYTAELPFSSKWSLNGLARYEWDGFGGKLSAQTSVTSVGPHYFDVANEPFVYEKRYFTADARIGFAARDDRWNVALWVRNLTDSQYRTFALDISTLSYGNQNYAAPRQVGGTFGVKF